MDREDRQPGDVVEEDIEHPTAELADEDVPVTAVSPEDEVEAYTREYADLRPLRFLYRPMTSKEEAAYLDKMTSTRQRVKIAGSRRQARKVVDTGSPDMQRLAKLNWDLLAEHIIDGEVYNSSREKIDFSNPEDWSKVESRVVFDMVNVIAGLNEEVVDAEETAITGL
jgi:hypothetical protein